MSPWWVLLPKSTDNVPSVESSSAEVVYSTLTPQYYKVPITPLCLENVASFIASL